MAAQAHMIPELDRKGLRDFGLVTGAIVAVLFGVALPWLLEHAFPVWPWVVLAVLGGWGLLAPTSLRPVYRVWMRIGLLLSKVTTPIIMGAVFFLIIAPLGIGMRLARRDVLGRRLDPSVKTYRVPSHKSPKERLEKPF